MFTAVIEDSTDQGFKFTWSISDENQHVTKENQLQWTADREPSTIEATVRADNGSVKERSVAKKFDVEVVEQKLVEQVTSAS